MNLDKLFMQLAFNEAFKYIFVTYPNPAVGAVVVKNGAILGIAAHKKAGTSHAEVIALLNAYESLSGTKVEFSKSDATKAHEFLAKNRELFSDCEIYVTLEPCSHIGKTPSCANLIKELKLKAVHIGSLDPIASHSGGIEMLKQNGIKVNMGILQEKTDILIEPFKICQKRAFVLFKLAQSTNGQIGCGYISSKSSLKKVHQLREVCTTLLIGGNTVRVDKPTLDCRFIEKKAPNVHIYSQKDDFSKDIPLFSVPNREVTIGSNLDFLDKPGFVLVEGGEGMLKAMQKYMDWLLIFQAPKLMANCLSYNINTKLQFLHIEQNDDILIWSKPLG